MVSNKGFLTGLFTALHVHFSIHISKTAFTFKNSKNLMHVSSCNKISHKDSM